MGEGNVAGEPVLKRVTPMAWGTVSGFVYGVVAGTHRVPGIPASTVGMAPGGVSPGVTEAGSV